MSIDAGDADDLATSEDRSHRPLAQFLRRLRSNRSAMVALGFLAALAIACLAAPLIAPQ